MNTRQNGLRDLPSPAPVRWAHERSLLVACSAAAAFLVASAPAAAFAQEWGEPAQAAPVEPVAPPTPAPAASPSPQVLPPGTRVVVSGNTTFILLPDGPAAPVSVPPPPAYTEPVQIRAAVQTHKERHWYGWQTLLADGVAITLAAAAEQRPELCGIAYLGGAPLVHMAHGHVGRGFASAGLRLGLPVTGALLGAGVSGTDGYDRVGLAVAGAAIGIISASVIDAAVLSFDETDEVVKEAKRPSFVVEPTLSAQKGGGTIGLVGAF